MFTHEQKERYMQVCRDLLNQYEAEDDGPRIISLLVMRHSVTSTNWSQNSNTSIPHQRKMSGCSPQQDVYSRGMEYGKSASQEKYGLIVLTADTYKCRFESLRHVELKSQDWVLRCVKRDTKSPVLHLWQQKQVRHCTYDTNVFPTVFPLCN